MDRFFLFFFLVVVLLRQSAFAQPLQYQFGRIDIAKGLSHQTVNDIHKDETGYMWFATASGLNRYDGYSIKVFRNIPGDSTSIASNEVNRLYEGPGGMLWIYSYSGNNVYNPRTETFYRNTNALLNSMGISTGVITYIKKDKAGNFWFIHYNQGLFHFNPATKKTTRLVPVANDSGSIASLQMAALEEDTQGDMWLIHQNGTFEKIDHESMRVTYRNAELRDRFNAQLFEYILMIDSDNDLWMASDRNFGCFHFDVEKRTLTNFNRESKTKLTSNIVKKIVQDDKGIIWVGTENGGVNLINKKDLSVTSLLYDEEDNRSLSENSIHSMLKDREGIIWLGTYKNGVSFYHPDIFRFQMYKNQRSKRNSLPFNDINAVAGDAVGNLWIGTNGGGLIFFDRQQNTFKQYLHEPSNPNSLSNNVIVSLLIDHENALWIGTYYGGLNRFDGKRFRRYMHNPSDPKSPGDDNAWDICEDSNHNLWIGTLKGGVDVYNREKDEFYHYKNGEANSIHTSYVPAVMEDKDGNMWMGTGYGVEVLDKQSGRFIHYLNDPKDSTSVSDNSTIAVIQDQRGLIWIGTRSGLNLYEPVTKTFRVFREEDGLRHNFILALVEDNNHNIWIGTPQGLSKLVITESSAKAIGSERYTFSFVNYGESDGLWGSAFHENAALKCSTGELVFGGLQGFTVFQPTKIGKDETVPTVVFTDFQLFNRSVKIGEVSNRDIVLPAAVSHLSEITLKPDNNIFSIEFAALNFFHPEKTKYKYKLEGFNKGWLTTEGTQRSVTFTNLDPGEYSFQVMASNSEGLWSDQPTTVRINVLPPFWKSNTAFILYSIFIMGTLLFVRWLTVTRLRMNFKIHHERLEAQRMHELDMMKIKFFTNVSHEFRTPLTLILTPLEKLLGKAKASGEDVTQIQLIHRNARRLLNLVNQLLDFRKMEVQEVKLNPSEGDIIGFIKYLVYSFSDLSEKKNINLSFSTTVQQLETFFDQDKVEKILFNLLSNAFKFTPEGGNVNVELSLKEKEGSDFLVMKVIDTGIGIPADKQQKIFDRFFQNELPENLVNQGSGIGLAITWEFVKVHGGTIEVDSEPGKGSCFTVLLPVTRLASETVMNYTETDDEEKEILDEGNNGKPVLLLVEDNEDFRFYLKDNLKSQYAILEASNGKTGFQKALTAIPDLIVSDIMMPEMNGVEFCKKVKNDVHTSHIPVILLTARAAEEQKIEGFESGASDYVTKPFSFEILQSRIKNLLLQREASQKQFQKHFDVKASNIEITSLDEKLIKKAIELVELNITEPDFSVENLSRELGMSRVYLYKKLLSLTGKSPLEFIRTIRLQQAAQLLEKSQLNVSEVAYKVGFNNPKYFAKCFKEEYKMLPSAYASSKNRGVVDGQ